MICPDVLNHILSTHLTPKDIASFHSSNPILYKQCILSFLRNWIDAESFWDYARQLHDAYKPHPYLAYQMYNGQNKCFDGPTHLPSLTDVRKEWHSFFTQVAWSMKENQVWHEWTQHCANQYPTESRILCQHCRIHVPQEESWNETVCDFCHQTQ